MFEDAPQEIVPTHHHGGDGGGGGGGSPTPAPRASGSSVPRSAGTAGGAAHFGYASHFADGPSAEERAADKSADVIDADLKVVALKLAGSLPELAAAAKQAEAEEPLIASARDEYQKAVKKVEHYHKEILKAYEEENHWRVTSAKEQKQLWKERRDQLALDCQAAAGPKYTIIAKVRDRVLRTALSKATKDLTAIFERTKASAVPANISAGADYVSHVMAQVRQHTATLEMAGNQTDPLTGKPMWAEQQGLGELVAAEAVVTDIRKALKIENHVSKPLELDLEKDMDGLKTDVVAANLEAATAQAQLLSQRLDEWRRIPKGQGPAENQYAELGAAVEAVRDHMAAAESEMANIPDEGKVQMKGRLAALKRELTKVYRKGGLDSKGGAPGSMAGDIEYFPSSMKSLQNAAKPAQPSNNRR